MRTLFTLSALLLLIPIFGCGGGETAPDAAPAASAESSTASDDEEEKINSMDFEQGTVETDAAMDAEDEGAEGAGDDGEGSSEDAG